MILLSTGLVAQTGGPPDPPGAHGSSGDQPPGGSASLNDGLIVLIGLGCFYAYKKMGRTGD